MGKTFDPDHHEPTTIADLGREILENDGVAKADRVGIGCATIPSQARRESIQKL